MKTLEEYLLESLRTHLYIDYNLKEFAGLYDGIEDLCNFLSNKIRSHQEKEFKIIYRDEELSRLHNIFFKYIVLKCERSNKYDNDGEYELNSYIDYDRNEDKMNCVVIHLYLSSIHNQQDVYSILLHELTHAWDDFNGFKKQSSSLKRVSYYKNIIKALDGEGAQKTLGQILYYITPSELNARIAELAGSLYIEDDIVDAHRALQIIKNSDIYKNYIHIGEWVDAIYNDKLDKSFIDNICNEYNIVYGKDYTEYKIKKLLYNQYQSAINKIESNIGKICARYVKKMK